jgi:transposase
MGLGTRIFIIGDNDSMTRMPVKRFNRLIRRDPAERFPEYAGKRVRYALIVIESENRKPVEVLKAQYSYMAFDPEGRLREDEREKVTRLSMELVEPLSGDQDETVINACHKFARKRFDREYRWAPTEEIGAAIYTAIFGKP